MSKTEKWQAWLSHMQQQEVEDLQLNEKEISAELTRMQEREGSWVIKIISVIGGFLATQFFTGFLFVSSILTSAIGSLMVGCIFWVGSLFFIRKTNQLVQDTMAVTIYLLAYVLLGVGLIMLHWNDNVTAIIIMLIAMGALFFIRHTVLAFFTCMIFMSGAVFLFYNNHLGSWSQCWPAVLAIFIAAMYWKEAAIIRFHPRCIDWYQPLLISLILFLSDFYNYSESGISLRVLEPISLIPHFGYWY